MTFWKRLRTYLVGVGLGLVLVYVFFNDRDLSGWTPQGRVLTAIDSSQVSISERALCQMQCYALENEEWREIQKQESITVDFSESNVNKKPCPVYHLKSIYKEEKFRLIWEVCEDAEKVKLLSLIKEGQKCDCG